MPRQGQEEGSALLGPAPGDDRAAVQGGVLQGDRQSEPRPAQGPLARGIGTVEAVEDLLDDIGTHADSVIADPHGHRIVRLGDGDVDARALRVLDGIDDEIAQNPLDARGVDLGDHRFGRRIEHDLRALGLDVHGDQVQHP